MFHHSFQVNIFQIDAHRASTGLVELIDPVMGRWDDEVVRQTFWPQDVKRILSTLVHPNLDNIMAWHYDTRGLFSVRSDYKVQRAVQRRERSSGDASSTRGHSMEEQRWKKLWKMKCPGKVKHFLWCMTHTTLALRMTLKRRGMELDSRCVMCNRLNEDGGHLFFSCKSGWQI